MTDPNTSFSYKSTGNIITQNDVAAWDDDALLAIATCNKDSLRRLLRVGSNALSMSLKKAAIANARAGSLAAASAEDKKTIEDLQDDVKFWVSGTGWSRYYPASDRPTYIAARVALTRVRETIRNREDIWLDDKTVPWEVLMLVKQLATKAVNAELASLKGRWSGDPRLTPAPGYTMKELEDFEAIDGERMALLSTIAQLKEERDDLLDTVTQVHNNLLKVGLVTSLILENHGMEFSQELPEEEDA